MPRLMTHSQSFVADRGDPPPPSNKIPKSPFPPVCHLHTCYILLVLKLNLTKAKLKLKLFVQEKISMSFTAV